MKKHYLKSITIVALLFSSLFLFSCKKKCDLGENVTSGEIKTGVFVYPKSGFLTKNLGSEENYLITGSHMYADRFEISFDNGMTKSAVNYSQNSIICCPTTVNCYAQFDRNVTIDHNNGIVKYTIKVSECESCDDKRYVENYVVIPAVPDSYHVVIDIQ